MFDMVHYAFKKFTRSGRIPPFVLGKISSETKIDWTCPRTKLADAKKKEQEEEENHIEDAEEDLM